jgi:hypothetical protein
LLIDLQLRIQQFESTVEVLGLKKKHKKSRESGEGALQSTECSRLCVTTRSKIAAKPLVGAEEEMGETLEKINIEETIKINPV